MSGSGKFILIPKLHRVSQGRFQVGFEFEFQVVVKEGVQFQNPPGKLQNGLSTSESTPGDSNVEILTAIPHSNFLHFDFKLDLNLNFKL